MEWELFISPSRNTKMIGELRTAILQTEGEIFKIGLTLDKETNLNNYVKIKNELENKKVRHAQYVNVLNELEKMEKLSQIKRKMRVG